MSGILVTSDWHAHAWPRFSSTLPDGTNSRFRDLLSVIDQIENLIEQTCPSALLILGDLTHRRQYVQFSTYTELVRRLHDIGHYTPIIMLVGNHDIESRGFHSLGPLRYVNNITVVDSPSWVEIPDYGFVYLVPYMSGDNVVIAARGQFDEYGARYMYPTGVPRTVFLHYALDGKVLDNEFVVPSSLRYDDVAWCDRVILGHVHSPSIEHDEKVFYTGSVMHLDFGDHGPRYAWWFGQQPDDIHQFELTAPRFMTATYPRVPLPPACGGFLRVVNVPSTLVHDVQQAARDQGWSHVVVLQESLPHEAVKTLSQTVFVDEQAVHEYVTRRYSDADQSLRDALIDYGVDVLRRANG